MKEHYPGKPSYMMQESWDKLCERSFGCVYARAAIDMASYNHELIADALVEVLLSLSAHNEEFTKRMTEMLERHPAPTMIPLKEFKP